jgi:two-component system, OmpR family, sensor histidine kinase CiaH
MFSRAVITLTAWYVVVLMTITIIFSATIFRLASAELDRSVQTQGKRQEQVFRDQFMPQSLRNQLAQLAQARAEQLEESRDALLRRVLWIDFTILFVGGGVCWFLARRTLAPLEKASLDQQRFAADASHELRTPLTAIRTELEVALRQKSLSLDESKALHTSTLEEVARLESLAGGLLQLARTEHAQIQEHFKVIDLDAIAEKITEQMRKLAAKKQIALTIHTVPAQVKGDQTALEQLLTIFIDNAIKYTGEKGAVHVSLKRDHQKVILEIADNGRGINAESLPKIFDRFYRSDSSRTSQGNAAGYGLGLSIAKQIIELHKATVKVASIPEKGTTFTITFPAIRAARISHS